MNRSSLYKGCLEPIILQLLNQQGRMYGYQITQEVKKLTGGEFNITEGALYPLLHRLEESGVVETETEHIGNRVRKYYVLTCEGEKEVVKATEGLLGLIRSLEQIICPKRPALEGLRR